jgi:adenosine/AMP kinase
VAARCAGGPGSLVKAFTFDDAITRRAAQSQAAADAGPKRVASARTISAGHAFVQNLRRDHYPITVELPWQDRVRVVFGELASSP